MLAVHFALAVGGKRASGAATDELVHLTAGFSYWQNHDYRLHPENGILPQRWAALPAWLAGATFPLLAGNDYWRTSDAWVVGHQFFYETGEDHFPRLMAGRAMIALFSAATGLLVFCWSRKFFGPAGALVSLVLFVFCPTFLAHGALVTSDVCMAFFLLAACGAWWRHLHDGRARWWWLSALTLGLAFVAKYTAVLLLPMMVAMALVRAWHPAPLRLAGRDFTTHLTKFAAAALSAVAHGVVVAGVIWLFYGFRFSAFNPALPLADHFIRPWTQMVGGLGLSGLAIQAAATLHALPEAFLYGFAYVLETTKARSAFLNGAYSSTGWPSFFPWAFLLKTTLPLLLASLLGGWLALRRWRSLGRPTLRRDLYRLTPLLVLFGLYWAFSITSHLNIGHRHILPTYPVLFIGAGALGAWLVSRRRALSAVVLGLLGWHAAEAVWIAPHHLAYFNKLAGGPANGRHHLVDSSLDWGQDLPGLKSWLTVHGGGAPVFLSYFGAGEPDYYGIKAHRLVFLNNFKNPIYHVTLAPGIYCISATMLSHVYSPFKGPWTLAFESRYQKLRALEPAFIAYNQGHAEIDRDLPPGRVPGLIAEYDQLRLARLSHYLRLRRPDADIGYSILIFRLTAAEIHAATAGSLAEWAALIERTITPSGN